MSTVHIKSTNKNDDVNVTLKISHESAMRLLTYASQLKQYDDSRVTVSQSLDSVFGELPETTGVMVKRDTKKGGKTK